MGCNCKITEIIIGIVVIVFAYITWILNDVNLSRWILIVAGAVLILHALMCKNCGNCKNCAINTKGGKNLQSVKSKK